jgi:hypothetical protein
MQGYYAIALVVSWDRFYCNLDFISSSSLVGINPFATETSAPAIALSNSFGNQAEALSGA